MKSSHLWLPSLALAAAGGWLTASLFALPARGKEPRFPQLTMEQLNEQQRPLGERVMKVSSVGLAGPYNPMMRSPVLGQRLFDLFHYLRWETSVPTKLNEFAILIIGRQWRSQIEWYAHARWRRRPASRRRSSPSSRPINAPPAWPRTRLSSTTSSPRSRQRKKCRTRLMPAPGKYLTTSR